MFKRTKVASGIMAALGGALLLAHPALFAQTAERVEVTGTRIKTIDAASSSPVSTLTASELNSSQPVAVEEIIRSLPNSVPAIGPGTNNGSGGGATIDLRGLGTGSISGASRTLVLVNGRRVVPFNLTGFVDTNSIPIALIDRVEIVTGGASAVYGADAVAGVVNFVLKKKFNGVELNGSYGTSAEGDANRYRLDVTMGANLADNRGSVMLSLGKAKTDPLTQGARPTGLSALSSGTGLPQGSQTDVPSQFTGLPGGLGNKQIDPVSGRLVDPGPGFNFQPVNYYQTPLERQQASAIANFVINDKAEVYAELMHSRNDVVQNLAGTGTFLNTYTLPIGNPFIPEPARQQLCTAFGISAANCVAGNTTPVTMAIGRRITELGPRIGRFENKTTQWTLGVKGSLAGSWGYDAYVSRGEADQVRTLGNWGSLSKVRQALDAISTTACRNTANGCVPLNVFGPDGSITPAMLNFINLDSLQLQFVEQDVMAANVTGDLGSFKSPWARSPISVALGVEKRDLFAGNKSDSASQIQGEVLGTGAPLPDRNGNVSLKEAYAEAIVPLLQGKPFVHSLSLEAGFRATEFTTTNTDSYNTHKLGAEWAPIKGLRFRGMTQKATRAPSINELYAPQTSGLTNLAVDPCQLNRINPAEANTPGTLANLCRLTGVPVNQIGQLPSPSAGQINNLAGGNPALGPEEADTQTLGLVWEPEFAKGLTFTLDFYTIKIEKAISSASATDILTQCYNPTANPTFALNEFCALVLRNPLNGTFNGSDAPGVFTASSNLGKFSTKGMDISVNYRLALRDLGMNPKWGRVDFGLNYTKVDELKFQATPSSVNRECNGFYSVACGNAFGSPNFKQKWMQRTTWAFGDWTLGYVWRHQGAVIEEPGGTDFLPAFARIKAYDYVDLAASWQASKNVRLSLAVNNAFDKQPPLIGNTIGTTSANSGNTFPQSYDTIGRYYNVGVNVKF